MSYLRLLVKGSKQLKVRLNKSQLQKFDIYLKQLQNFNKKFNLTAITTSTEIVKKHFLDSLSILTTKYVLTGKRLLDVGAGAGFPGLVLKIAIPGLKLTLLEANKKKSFFMEHIIKKLELKSSNVINMRAEEFAKTAGKNKFDLAVTRALASLSVNLEYVIPALKVKGYYLAMKSNLAKEPSTDIACSELKCTLIGIKKLSVPYVEGQRNIVIFRKEKETPSKYPRRTGKPAKKPL